MNHKRKRPKNARAGCLMCKPWKGNGMKRRGACAPLVERTARVTASEQLVQGGEPWVHPDEIGEDDAPWWYALGDCGVPDCLDCMNWREQYAPPPVRFTFGEMFR